jgi:1,4-alpha-glucan branching enzyme
MYGHPGKKLLFMGGEIGQYREWNHDDQLDWSLLKHERHRGLQRMTADLNRTYRAEPALYEVDYSPAGFEWVDHTDANRGVISFLRFAAERREHVLVVSNLTPVVRQDYRVGVPLPGTYHEIFNTDAELYGGSNVGNQGGRHADAIPSHGRPQSLSLVLPPLATVYFKHAG